MNIALKYCGSSALILFAFTSGSVAEDFVISGDATTRNNGAVLDGGDSIVVTETGSVTTNVILGSGLLANGDDNTLINNGSITTSGRASVGIVVNGNSNTLTNNGSIRTGDSDSHGMSAAGNDNIMTNRGTITTSGSSAHGMNVNGSRNSLTNSGTISTSGDTSRGIYAQGNDLTVVNTGTVTARGNSAAAVFSNGNRNTVTNSGTIISEQDFSIRMSRPEATVNLLRGSVLYGDVHFGNGATGTLNFGVGLNASVRIDNSLPSTITVANGSYVVSGSTVHVIDANSIAINDRTPGVVSGMILDALETGLSVGAVQATRGHTYADVGWVDAFGGRSEHDGDSTSLAYSTDTWGLLAGRSIDATRGLFVGAARSDTVSNQVFSTRTDTVFVGYFVNSALGDVEVDTALTFGASQNRTMRRVANNTVVGGLETAVGEYLSYFLMPSATFRVGWHLGGNQFDTSVRMRYAALHDRGYSETGAAAAVAVGSRTSHLGEVRLQVSGALVDVETLRGSFTTSLRLGADASYLNGDQVSGTLAGQPIAFSTNADTTSGRAFAGLDIMHTIAGGVGELRGGIEVGRTSSGPTDISASLRWQMRF